MQNATQTLGMLLKQKRDDKGLSKNEVARSLNLTVHAIDAIEADNFNALPGATYVRGYLRSYAQLLNISADSIIDNFNEVSVSAEQEQEGENDAYRAPVTRQQRSSSDKWMMLGTALVATAIIGLAITWWQGKESEPITKSTKTTDIIDSANNGISVNPLSAADTEGNPVGITIKDSDTHLTQNRTDTLTEGNTETAKTVSVVNALDVSAKKTADNASGMVRSKLILRAVESTWADIRDAQNNKLLYEKVSAGRIVTIEGVAPFNVYLGNAAGVRIQYNGKQYDIEKHRHGLVARFKLGDPLN